MLSHLDHVLTHENDFLCRWTWMIKEAPTHLNPPLTPSIGKRTLLEFKLCDVLCDLIDEEARIPITLGSQFKVSLSKKKYERMNQ